MSSISELMFKRSVITLLLLGGPAVQAWAVPSGCAGLSPVPASIEMDQGLQQEIRLPVAITRVAVGDPNIADVQASGERAIVLSAVGPGATSLMLWTACASAPRQSMLFIKGRATAEMDDSAMPPSLEPPLPSQVQADIRFVEVSRTKLKEAGTRLFFKGSNNSLFGSPGSVPNTTVTPGYVPGAVTSPDGGGVGGLVKVRPSIPLNNDVFNIVWGGGSSRFLAAIDALESSGFAYTLARPSLVVLSGLTASFLAGGQIPIPVPSTGSDTVTIEYKEFGIRLTLTPTVIDRNRVTLKVAPEVSELDYANAINIGGTPVPALTVRRTDTSVSLADGESFVISGLISTTNNSQVNKFPGLGDIPVIGAFFRDSQIKREERELLMIVTPHLVQPLAADAQLPSLPGEKLRNYDPNFYRMFFLENGNFDKRSGLSQ